MSTTANSVPTAGGEEPARSRLLADLRLENDALVMKLAQLSRAMRNLAGDLAVARRDARHKRQQIEALRTENARLRAHFPRSLLDAG